MLMLETVAELGVAVGCKVATMYPERSPRPIFDDSMARLRFIIDVADSLERMLVDSGRKWGESADWISVCDNAATLIVRTFYNIPADWTEPVPDSIALESLECDE